MQRAWSILVLLASVASATAQPVPRDYSPESSTHYLDCLREQTQRLDDGVSDAATVGRQIVQFCRQARLPLLRDMAPKSKLIAQLQSRPMPAFLQDDHPSQP